MDTNNNNLNAVTSFFFWQNEHHKDIRSVLGVKRMTCKTKNELQNAHRIFVMNLGINISRYSKTKAKLEKIYKVLRKYEDMDSLTEQVLILALPHTKCPSISELNHNIRKLCERADIAIKNLPPKDKSGPDEKIWPLRTLVARLNIIYEETTGSKATLIKAKESSATSKRASVKNNIPSGPFFDFVKKYLQIIKYKPHSDIALMRVIERVLYN